MPPEARVTIEQILKAADEVRTYTLGLDAGLVDGNSQVRSAVYWQFVVIGEGMVRLRKFWPEGFERVPEAPKVVGLRNQIIHGYDRIRDEQLWRIITEDVPALEATLQGLLAG